MAAGVRKRWWVFRNQFYWEDEGLSAEDVKALILDRIEQERKRVQRAKARLSAAAGTSAVEREPLPEEITTLVWRRDGGRCVRCGSQEKLEFDHIIPLSKGGSSTARNIQLLCEKCNREKEVTSYEGASSLRARRQPPDKFKQPTRQKDDMPPN